MSYYTEQLSTKIIDANVYVPNLRVEFQIPAGDYGNRWRLQDVGLTLATATTDVKYNTLAGAFATIKSIRLLNGRDELDACLDVNRYLAFKNFNKRNSPNSSKMDRYNYAQGGYVLTNVSLGAGVVSQFIFSPDLSVANVSQLTTDPATTPKGYLDLRECLPLLRVIEVLPASLFGQLRLVIEYETDPVNMVSKTQTAVNTTRPTLSVDVIEDEKLVKSMSANVNGSSWNAIEHDLFRMVNGTVTAGAPNGTDVAQQQTSARLNGFNNKRLMRFAIAKNYTNTSAYKTTDAGTGVISVDAGGGLSSEALINEAFQVRINGSTKIARNGANRRNQRLAMTVDAFGECNSYCGSNVVSANQAGSRLSTGNLRGGGQDFYGLYVNEVIKDLQIVIARDVFASDANVATTLAPQKANLDVHVFGEVRKQMVVSNGNYQIIYA